MGDKEAKTGESQRKQTRYAVSDDCRIRASISIQSSEPGAVHKDWPGVLVDLSPGGCHVQISIGAVAYNGDSCVVKLSHGTMKTEVRGILAHYVCSARYSVCGVRFNSYAGESDKVLQSFLKAVIASATLKGGPTDSDISGQYKEEYRGAGHTKLVAYRNNKPERGVVAFDYTMGRFGASLMGGDADMFKNKSMVIFKAAPTEKGGAGAPLVESQIAEARWEFAVAASNLPKVVPPDLRKFLRLVS